MPDGLVRRAVVVGRAVGKAGIGRGALRVKRLRRRASAHGPPGDGQPVKSALQPDDGRVLPQQRLVFRPGDAAAARGDDAAGAFALSGDALERGIKAFATSFEEAQALLAGMQESQKTLAQALEKLNAAATSAQHDLPQALQSTRDAMNNVSSVSLATKAVVERNAPLTQELRRLIQESAAAVRSLRAFMDVLERNPEALLRGKQGSRR